VVFVVESPVETFALKTMSPVEVAPAAKYTGPFVVSVAKNVIATFVTPLAPLNLN
jgi:hypothetical protein